VDTVTWQPEPGWQPLPGGTGPATVGVWEALHGGRRVVVKRLAPPAGDDPDQVSPRGYAYWRREADAAADGLLTATAGLRAAPAVAVDEDAAGVVVVRDWVADAANNGLFRARALGRFASLPVPDRPWLARDQLRHRLRRVERRGGWPTIARTTAADLADHLWRRRLHHLDRLDGLPQVLQHGDPTPANLVGRTRDDGGDHVVAIDWGGLGTGPLGADLGLLALSAREDLEPLLDAYVEGYAGESAGGSADLLAGASEVRDQALLGARVSAVYTAFSRAEWALAHVAAGEGALAGKFRHPAVAPYLRALQRLGPQVEALL
jgi:hypothetical protein